MVCSFLLVMIRKHFSLLQTVIEDTHIGPIGHLKISWTMTAEVEIDKISRDHLMRIHVQYFMIWCFTFIVNSWGRAGTAIAYPNQPFLRRLTWLERFTSTQWHPFLSVTNLIEIIWEYTDFPLGLSVQMIRLQLSSNWPVRTIIW